MESKTTWIGWGPLGRRMGLALFASAAIALVLTWAKTGELFGADPWGELFLSRFAQLAMIGVVIVVHKIGFLVAITTGILLALAAVVLFEGQMADYRVIGKFFLDAMKMIIVPLIFFAMVSSITAMGDVRKLGRLGRRTVLYYLVTTTVAVVLGTLLVNLIGPGEGLNLSLADYDIPEKIAANRDKGFDDIILSFVSPNIAGSFATGQMLPIIVFSLVFGAVLTTLGKRGSTVIAFCDGGNEAMMKIVTIVMVLAPVGVFGLLAGEFGSVIEKNGMDGFLGMLEDVASYSITVVAGLALHAFIVIPLLLKFTTGRSPLHYARGVGGALMTAFSTASSAATLPLTLESVEDNNNVSPKAARFVIPLGATVNMDGTALYEAVAVIFIAQAFNIDLSFGAQVIIVITATLAAVGAAGIPQAGFVTMAIVLQAVGLPLEGAAVVIAVDPILDRFRTTVNVWGDAVGAAVMERHGLDPDDVQTPAGIAAIEASGS